MTSLRVWKSSLVVSWISKTTYSTLTDSLLRDAEVLKLIHAYLKCRSETKSSQCWSVYMKNIHPLSSDLKEYVITERDFKYYVPCRFKDLYLLNLQEDFQLGIESYQTQLNLTKPRWAATRFEFKHDYIVIDSPRAVTFRDRYGVQMIMRVNKAKLDEYKILDEERRCQKQGVHVRYPKTAKDMTYLLESGKLCWWMNSRRRLPVTEENRMRGNLNMEICHGDPLKRNLLITGRSSRIHEVTNRTQAIDNGNIRHKLYCLTFYYRDWRYLFSGVNSPTNAQS
ncbi:hypothetical protein Tco_1359541 [Tanacetum coccineum]